jgi:hypothetical protein
LPDIEAKTKRGAIGWRRRSKPRHSDRMKADLALNLEFTDSFLLAHGLEQHEELVESVARGFRKPQCVSRKCWFVSSWPRMRAFITAAMSLPSTGNTVMRRYAFGSNRSPPGRRHEPHAGGVIDHAVEVLA